MIPQQLCRYAVSIGIRNLYTMCNLLVQGIKNTVLKIIVEKYTILLFFLPWVLYNNFFFFIIPSQGSQSAAVSIFIRIHRYNFQIFNSDNNYYHIRTLACKFLCIKLDSFLRKQTILHNMQYNFCTHSQEYDASMDLIVDRSLSWETSLFFFFILHVRTY